jgi:hypothetical protein
MNRQSGPWPPGFFLVIWYVILDNLVQFLFQNFENLPKLKVGLKNTKIKVVNDSLPKQK